jgi:hypothetical protein
MAWGRSSGQWRHGGFPEESMAYFVTGATGFIGRFLVERLLARSRPVYVLVRKESIAKLHALRASWGAGAERVIPVVGDLDKPRLGLSAPAIARLRGRIDGLPPSTTSPRRPRGSKGRTSRARAMRSKRRGSCRHAASTT